MDRESGIDTTSHSDKMHERKNAGWEGSKLKGTHTHAHTQPHARARTHTRSITPRPTAAANFNFFLSADSSAQHLEPKQSAPGLVLQMAYSNDFQT